MRTETINVIQKPTTDRNGDPVTPVAPGVPLPGCVIWPRASEEKDSGDVAVDGENVAAPDNATSQAIGFEDWLEIRGEVHMVDEPPGRYVGRRIMIKTRRIRT